MWKINDILYMYYSQKKAVIILKCNENLMRLSFQFDKLSLNIMLVSRNLKITY